ncbi:helix-turn-helix domain-containing protein [Halorubrum vacuolatum]|uniref:HTH DNA binding domain-containing protein n=1 Tax=Halorubrum vacuolatum TaxID=63740 RepID=A0A238VK75_HALVU|nr:helix-turn-helix domain-containing protein [Halorubrum vacuolatum]SNR34591.1 HTH DNA binding domain-containing protein [Halorubrum vacuolatum]
MAVIADITVRTPADETNMLVEAAPEGIVRIPFMFGSENIVISYVLVRRDGLDEFHGELDGRRESAVTDVRVIDEFVAYALVHVTYPWHADAILVSLVNAGLDVLEGLGTAEEWTFRVRAYECDAIDRFVEKCTRAGATAAVDRIDGAGRNEEPILTPAQRRTLHTAYETGYFEVPRRTSLSQLSEQFDVSDTAVSQRLRRGINAVLAAQFDDDTASPTD